MTTSALATAIIIIGATILVLGSVPTKNTIEDNTLTVHFLIGKKVIDITGAKFLPVSVSKEALRPLQEHENQKQVHFISDRQGRKSLFRDR